MTACTEWPSGQSHLGNVISQHVSYSIYTVNNNDVCINVVHVKFEVLTVLTMKMTDCLDGSPCTWCSQ